MSICLLSRSPIFSYYFLFRTTLNVQKSFEVGADAYRSEGLIIGGGNNFHDNLTHICSWGLIALLHQLHRANFQLWQEQERSPNCYIDPMLHMLTLSLQGAELPAGCRGTKWMVGQRKEAPPRSMACS